MEKTIDASDARRRIDGILREVAAKGDHYVVNDHGEAVAAVIPIALYERWKRDREVFFDRWEAIAARADLPEDEAGELAREAIEAIRRERR